MIIHCLSMRTIFIVTLTLVVASGCSNKKHEKEQHTSIPEYQPSPAKSLSAEPYLFTDKNEVVYMSWVEKKDETNFFKFSRLTEDRWSEPALIASGNTWFVNWADYPMIATDGNGNFVSHVLDKRGDGGYTYDVKIFASADGGKNWTVPFTLNDDGKQAEHGFVTLVPYGDKFLVSWLDGRNTVMEGMDHGDGHHGSMNLRVAIIDYNGKKMDEWELDNKTCECCQTTAAITDNGPVIIYRDRSDEEIRDMSIVRLVNGSWTKPQSIFPDNWKIAGCPVNGPRSASIGNNLAIAWFSAPDENAKVQVIFSTDGGVTFGKPVRVDEGKPVGRVDVVMLDDSTSVVSWLEGGDIKVVRVSHDGVKGTPVTISHTSGARSSGFPQMTKSGNELIFAWTDDKEKTIKVASWLF